jgi:hypothetical protein
LGFLELAFLFLPRICCMAAWFCIICMRIYC